MTEFKQPRFYGFDSVMIFCLLDSQMPYSTVCKVFSALQESGIINRNRIKEASLESLTSILIDNGCRFPNQRARYIKHFGDNPIDLGTATRQELVKNIKGIGMKLASMFLNWTRGTEYAILDTHILSWLASEGLLTTKSYVELEKIFQTEAIKRGLTPSELDRIVWEQKRK